MQKMTILAVLLLLAPAMSQAVPALSQTKTLEDVLVEKGVITKGEAQAVQPAGPAKVYWNKGTRVDFPDTGFTAGINTFIQTRYTFTDNDEDAGGKNNSSFDVVKARIIAQGSALHEEFEYFLQGDFVGNTSGASKTTNLLDAYLKWNACDYASVQMGQFKTNIGRSFNANDWALLFADRAASANYFSLDRQSGAKMVSKLGEGVTFGAGIYNGAAITGEGINQTGIDTKHTGIADLRADLIGSMDAYTESDVDWTNELALNAGAAYAYTEGSIPAGAATSDLRMHNVAVDLNAKLEGFSANGEFFYQKFDPVDGTEAQPFGAYVQAGYFLEPKTWELAARWGVTDCDNGKAIGVCAGMNVINQATVGLNYYWWKHHLKAQLNYDYLNQDPEGGGAESIKTNRWLFQLSSYF